jgi:hypothetical protein
MAVLLVVVLVVALLLSCCCCCFYLLCCRIANTIAPTTIGMPPPLPLPLPLPLSSVDVEDDAFYTNANSSPATLAHTICWALEAHALLDRPLPAGRAGGKGGNNDGGTGGGSRSRIAHLIGMVLPSPTQGGMTVTRVVGK